MTHGRLAKPPGDMAMILKLELTVILTLFETSCL